MCVYTQDPVCFDDSGAEGDAGGPRPASSVTAKLRICPSWASLAAALKTICCITEGSF